MPFTFRIDAIAFSRVCSLGFIGQHHPVDFYEPLLELMYSAVIIQSFRQTSSASRRPHVGFQFKC
jgi:hypothetical protein